MLGTNYAPILRQANGLNRAPLGPRHLGVPSGVSKITFEPLECLVQTLHRNLQCLQTDQNEIPHDPRHLGVTSGPFKMISELVARSAQT
jgi:hypothetical protein